MFEYFVVENGKEIRETAKLVSKNMKERTQAFEGTNEPWITSTIVYR